MAILLSGCATDPVPIDRSVHAVSQDSRVRYVVLHYTALSAAESLRVLSTEDVSAHYLITDSSPPHVYQLVPETRRAWHAGESSWYGEISLNDSSVGIEIVNLGDSTGVWQPYTPEQIRMLIPLLRAIVRRNGIEPQNIVAHSDIAPQRKVDPGPLFPWHLLARQGLGRWYDAAAETAVLAQLRTEPLPDVGWFQQQLHRLGYDCPQDGQMTPATRRVIAAFQMHYRPSNYDGMPDAETAAIMMAMK
ncbi:MAG: N-acetylmuramoyl-L-alanine amidase [Bordetella sp.]|uniref:N-acetylmuramoyl-L-alanine amidase n=1 Tax=Bordetella sp. TaxID=28081 RepID=UPI003F7BA210